MITAIVFSRDRAMQLDLLLRSMPDGFSTFVLWKATTEDHETAYMMCEQDNAHATFYAESADGLPWRCREILQDYDLACFLTDDSVFYRQPELPQHLGDTILCHSFRLGRNTTWCYPHARTQGYHLGGPDTIIWAWVNADYDWGYPGSLDGHVFRAAHLRRCLLTASEDANPNRIEDHLNSWVKARLASEFPKMSCDVHSSLVGIPANRVNETHKNRYGEHAQFPADELCQRYLDGQRILFDRMDFSDIVGAHQEVPLVIG